MVKFELGQNVTIYMFCYDKETNEIKIYDLEYEVSFMDIKTTKYIDEPKNIKETTTIDYTFYRPYYTLIKDTDLNDFRNLDTPYYSLECNDKIIEEYSEYVKSYFETRIEENKDKINTLLNENKHLEQIIEKIKVEKVE